MDKYFTLQRYKFFSFGIVPQSVNFYRLRYAAAPLVWCFLRLTARFMPRHDASHHTFRERTCTQCHHTVTTLRMGLLAPDGASHASGMVCLITPSERPCSQCHHTVTTLRSATTLRGCTAGVVFPAPGGASHASGMMRLITPSERGRARSATTLSLHCALPPHCAAAPLVWCFLRLTARFMPPAWWVSSHLPREDLHAVPPHCHYTAYGVTCD